MTNKIGPHQFTALSGQWIPPAQKVRVEARPGVDGVEVTKEGKRGEPFSMTSTVDCENYKDAIDKFTEYTELVDADPVVVTQGDESSSAQKFKCKVIAVRKLHAGKLVNAIGNKQSEDAGALLVARWEMIAIEDA
ncbi:MAG: hypothetical protein GY838_03910 [bacterium]|nr:hypothetical protein [bacterium]